MTGAVHSERERTGPLRIDCHTVVVGSGAAGMVVATELAEAGTDVVVLEEGPFVRPDEYARWRPSESLRHVWRDGSLTVAFGLGGSPSVNVMMGRAVGGSSLLTGGVCFRIPESVLAHWSRELGLSGYAPHGMEPVFEHVERRLSVEEVPASMRSRSTVLFAEGAARIGLPMHPMRRNTVGCRGCGRCNFGCPHAAKTSVDVSYLPAALAHGVRVHSHCRVERVDFEGTRVRGVRGRLLNGPCGRPGDLLVVRAARVVLAAGAWCTPGILYRSGLGRRGGALGRYMTLHPAFRVFGLFDEPVRGWQGALQSAYSDGLEHEGITLTSLFVPPGIVAAALPGIGPAHARHVPDVERVAVFGGLIHDDPVGRLYHPFGRGPIATYRMSARDRARVPLLLDTMARAFFAAGARKVFLPVLGLPGVDADAFGRLELHRIPARRWECASQHPLGSAQMGTSPTHAVVDPDGKVWDVEGLYVACGSVMPTSLGVNPQLGIMAVATRIAWRMLGRL
ncbi:MAG: GMC family oxidoreductase [Myxococcota bacterium]|nr:GMC family oxidoreductase [Myxococcota bacterium]MDW8361856.1 GMC family oxidoreductase [Myxococcales bacterium]